MNKRTFLLTVFALIHINYIAKAHEYTIKHLGTQNNPLNNYITDISQDNQGYLWIATDSELSRFDGTKFTIYNSRNSALKNNALNTILFEEGNNRLWIGTKEGLYTMDCTTKQIDPFVLPEEAMLDNVMSLSFAPDSSIWITNLYHSIVRYTPKTEETEILTQSNVPGLYFSHNCTVDDGNGHLYVGHVHGGMSIINLKDYSIKNFRHDPNNPKSIPADWVNCIYIDHYDNVWIGTKKGLSLYNPYKEEFTNFYHQPNNDQSILSNDIHDIQVINETELWIACEIGGISILDLRSLAFNSPENITFKNITNTSNGEGLSSRTPRQIFQDSFGNVWIGNYSSGLDFISHTPSIFHTLPTKSVDGKTIVNNPSGGIYLNGKDLWIGNENELVLYNDNQIVKSFNLASAPFHAPNSQINAIIHTGKELLLGMSDAGVISFNPKTNQAKRLHLTKGNEAAYHFYKDKEQKIWIGAESGLYTYRDGHIQKETEISIQMNDLSVYGICTDQQDRLWIGSYGGGIFIFNKEKQLEYHISDESGLCDNSIFHLYKDSQERIWAATREGIACIEDTSQPTHVVNYGFENGMKNTFTRAIHEDNSGQIWISTTKGLTCLNTTTQRFYNYIHYNGVPNGSFCNGSVCKGSDGTLYFGSLHGVCHFQPNDIIKEYEIAPVRIVECMAINNHIEAVNNPILVSSALPKVYLPYNRNSFRIAFTIPDFSQSPSAEYAYRIEGLSKSWTHTQGENQVTFHNLPTGNYRFKVKARLNNQDWDEQNIATLHITIEPPVWLSWYAQIAYMILFLFILFFLIRIYQRHLRQKSSLELIQAKAKNEQELNQERLRFYTNITHELRTPLTLILGPLEDLTNDSGLSSVYKSKIKVIHSSAIRLLNLINQILEFRKTETQNRKLSVGQGNLQALVTEIGLRFKELNRSKTVKFNIDTQNYKATPFFDIDIVTTILNNLLSNAVKYTSEGEITLSLKESHEEGNDYTEISVSDTGYGIEPTVLPHIFDRYYQVKGVHQASGSGIGLALVKSLAELHEGTIHAESTPGQGSTFTFRILTGNSYPSALHRKEKPELPPEEATTPEKNENNNQSIILIVEDDDDIREYISSSLGTNFQVLEATNGKEGLDLAIQHIPDIIVSDIMMPVMDGLELCREIKKDVRTSHIPVVLLTAKDSMQDKEEGYESGADSYITKPFSVKLLISRINNLQKGREQLAKLVTQGNPSVEEKERTNMSPLDLGGGSNNLTISKLDNEFIKRFTQIVDENLTEKDLSISFLTERMNMTTSTLYRKIKGLTGLSANEFIRKYRLQKSLKYMKDEGYNISETAYACGFSDSGYFRNCFKQEFGITPSEYLKQLHQK